MEHELNKPCNCHFKIVRFIPTQETAKAAEVEIIQKARSCYHKDGDFVIWEFKK